MNSDFFDGFTVIFTQTESEIRYHRFPLGHYAVQAMEIPEETLAEIDRLGMDFLEEFNIFLHSRDNSSAAYAHTKLMTLWEKIGALPAYEYVRGEKLLASYLIPYMKEHPDEVNDMMTAGTERNEMYLLWVKKIREISQSIRLFQKRTWRTLIDAFEDLKGRTPSDYARAYSSFKVRTWDFLENYDEEVMGMSVEEREEAHQRFTFPVKLSYMATRVKGKEEFVLAEEMTFETLEDFLYIDFCKGLAAGNVPRRCKHCGRYFLAMGAYDVRYCNNIAPGETERTCRMVGAHHAEKLKTRSTFVLREYNRAYNRVKGRKQRGRITTEEWNRQVARLQEIKEEALQGKWSDEEAREKFGEV